MSRQKTGIKRPLQIHCYLDKQEYAALTRISKQTKTSKTDILRESFLFLHGIKTDKNEKKI